MYQPYRTVIPYVTKDGSQIRELMHPSLHGNKTQSLAEATIAIGGKTIRHKHVLSEELYHITQGHGLMMLNEDKFEVFSGDTICIPPGTEHCIENLAAGPLVILCCCSPAYAHEDTILTGA